MTSAKIWVGSGANVAAAVDVSGDVTMNNAGAVAIGANKVTFPMLAAAVGTGANTVCAGNDSRIANGQLGAVNFTVDGNGSVITTGLKGFLRCPFAGTISSATLMANANGNCVVDVWKGTYAAFPPTVANRITANAVPTLNNVQSYQDLSLTGWNTTVLAGDIFAFNVNSATTVTRLTLAIGITKS